MKSFLIALCTVFLFGCSTKYKNRQPVGEIFPSINGTSLSSIEVQIPQDFSGQKTIFLLGFDQDAQFDIDRWLIGLDQTKVTTDVYEVPTINSFWAEMMQSTIDDGMRSGIPQELWKAVITVYEDGEIIQKFTGNENPRNARAMVLDENGVIVFFHDRGFSVGALHQLRSSL